MQMTSWVARRGFVLSLIVVMTLLVAACGSDTREKGSETTSQNGEATAGANESGAEQETAEQKEGEQAVNWPRTFEHDFGTTTLEQEPQRVIALYMEDYLVALGIKPITQTVIGSFFLNYLQPEIGDLPKLDSSAVDFEVALEAQPDLILLAFPNYAMDGKYESFAKIAPTYVFGEEAPNQWRDALRTVGDLLGKEAEAERVLADYDAKVEAAKAQLATVLGDETVALVRVRSDKEIRLYGGPGGYVGNVLYTDLGLNPPAIVKELAWGEASMAVISQEVIPQIDADHLFITYDEGGKELAEEVMSGGLWKSLPAVQNGQVHAVSLDHWMTFGPVAYIKKVDDVLAALSPE
ncbi:ABC transporter substrate-binding protein [Paenibacillus sp. IB182496]|uniref:ABC transporter substrate-binding protein n=1 Tax=Paenibacillus sabuli TaxID=2772509 RepID=A0A927GTW6_9BACL|nr:ABC transporter substrate-binding protein [Paenibacillus sabuli]MBD2848294.1 ABC transporter substrate-binding protein [Paenibacillus sabuli]